MSGNDLSPGFESAAVELAAPGDELPARGLVAALRRVLPVGHPLPEEMWTKRHRTILILLWLHAVGLATFAFAQGQSIGHSLFEGSVIATLAVGATMGFSRRTRAILACLGIFSSSAVLVHLSGGTIEAHFHFFVMIGVISLYQDWAVFLVAVGYVVVHHGTVGVLSPESVYNHAAALAHPWVWAGIHGLFVLGACTVSLIAWRLNEDARAKAEEYYRRLYEGEHALVSELQEAQTVKDELIAMVSHELRTPLTAIIGFGHTLVEYWDRLTEEERRESADRSLRAAERLGRHVENLLEAARVNEPDPGAVTDLDSVVQEVLQDHRESPEHRVRVASSVPEGLATAVSMDALHLIVANLVGNAEKYATEGTTVQVKAGYAGEDGDMVVLTVANQAPTISADDQVRIFDAFVQLDSSATRLSSGMGLGLHIVHRIADMHGGSVEVSSEDGWVRFTVLLPAASHASDDPQAPAPAALHTASA